MTEVVKKKGNSATLMTEGNIPKHIVAFAMPVFLGNLFQQLYNTVDSLIVGNFVGDEALAAVSSSGTMIFLIVGLIFGLFSGAGVVISQFYGAEDKNNVQNAIHTTVALGIICGLLVMFVGVVFSPMILRLIGTPENVLPNSLLYFRIYFCGSLFNVLYNAGSGIFQAVGDSKHPLYYLIISSITNVVLDLIFVVNFGLGIAGAAAATVISQFISAFLTMNKLMHSDEDYRVYISRIKIHKNLVGRILRMGIPSGIQNSVIGLANIVVQANINSFGDIAMASCGSYAKLEGFAFLPITSFSMALTTFIGQNIGAHKIDRAKKGAKFGIISCVISAELIGLVMFFGMPVMIRWFSQNPEVIAMGIRQARTESLFFCLLSFSHGAAGIMRGAGKATVPMVVMLAFWCVFRVSFLTIVLKLINDIIIIYMVYPITWGMSTLTFAAYLLSGRWLKGHGKIS